MHIGFAAKYQLLLSSLLLGTFISCAVLLPACMDNNSHAHERVIFEPDSLHVISTSQKLGRLSAQLDQEEIQLKYWGAQEESVTVRIYDEQNNLVYGEQDLILPTDKVAKIDFDGFSTGIYQVYIFFKNGEFLNTEIELPQMKQLSDSL